MDGPFLRYGLAGAGRRSEAAGFAAQGLAGRSGPAGAFCRPPQAGRGGEGGGACHPEGGRVSKGSMNGQTLKRGVRTSSMKLGLFLRRLCTAEVPLQRSLSRSLKDGSEPRLTNLLARARAT